MRLMLTLLVTGMLGTSLVVSGCQSSHKQGTPPVATTHVTEIQRQLIWLKLEDLLTLEREQRYATMYDRLHQGPSAVGQMCRNRFG
jgi:hypothetical protein